MKSRELEEQICGVLRGNGHQAYLVGGCVRDLLLQREPADFDVSTDARPERVHELFPHSLDVGAKFGVTLIVEDDIHVEVATFRSDIGYSDGRHPDRVAYTDSPQEDVRRRDFTINGLLMDPVSGEVLDFVEGTAPICARELCAPSATPLLRFSGGQAAHCPSRALRRAIWIPHRNANHGCGAIARPASGPGFPRTPPR